MELRPYQEKAKTAISLEWAKGVKKTLLVLPTGTGKTIVFCKLIEDLVTQGERCLILAHRGELLDQAADKMRQATGLNCVTEKAEETAEGSFYRITVGSIQTLMRENRLSRFDRDHYDTIIVDEAHHVLADSYQRIFDYFENAKVLGVTATPDRGDMKNLGRFFDSIAYEYKLPMAIKEGFLAPIKALTIPLKLDLSNVSQQGGDFKASDVGNALDPFLEQIADEMALHCQGRKIVVFLPLIATSQKMCAFLNDKGFRAAEVNGESKNRSDILTDFNNEKYNVLCNSMLLTEGWDCPSVDTIVCLRPTKVRSLYCQMVGRGTRLFEGKEYLLLLDFLWHSSNHELCRPAYLIAESEEVAKKTTENLEANTGVAVDLEEAVEAGSKGCIESREESLAKKLAQLRHRKMKLVDPLQFEMSIEAQDLADYVPAFGWEMAPPSDAQRSALEKMGIMPDEIDNAGKATKILDRIEKRRDQGLTTPKQIRFLEQRNFKHVGTWEFVEAKKLIDRIAGNNWRTPHGIVPNEYNPTKI
jgi:superfamily II DNA or RNA helicase